MWNESETQRLRVSSLSELDQLIGERVMAAKPEVYWEESYARLRFDSVHEALAAMRDPYFQLFIPEDERAADVLAEVREYPAYSSDIRTAMGVVERMNSQAEPLHLQTQGGLWRASFGWNTEVSAGTAPKAICLAALWAKGWLVEFPEEPAEETQYLG